MKLWLVTLFPGAKTKQAIYTTKVAALESHPGLRTEFTRLSNILTLHDGSGREVGELRRIYSDFLYSNGLCGRTP